MEAVVQAKRIVRFLLLILALMADGVIQDMQHGIVCDWDRPAPLAM